MDEQGFSGFVLPIAPGWATGIPELDEDDCRRPAEIVQINPLTKLPNEKIDHKQTATDLVGLF